MKRFFCSLAAMLLLMAGARADEGMWLLPLLQKMNIKTMRQLGCRLSAEEIYSINHSSLKDAVVQFGGGCTGELISDEGLLVTNHHCGYGSIQRLSSEVHNYLEDGYWAMSRSEELPCKGLTVTFLRRMTDVTSVFEKERERLRDQFRKEMKAWDAGKESGEGNAVWRERVERLLQQSGPQEDGGQPAAKGAVTPEGARSPEGKADAQDAGRRAVETVQAEAEQPAAKGTVTPEGARPPEGKADAQDAGRRAEVEEEFIADGLDKKFSALIEEAEKAEPHSEAAIVGFYNGNVRYLVVSKTYRDVRFVGAPPASVGKFGGEADNWMWPRHTGDFSMFRIYAGRDNEPADYAEENVPYTPEQSLKISLKGMQEGDFTFIMGYPGGTQRFQSAAQLNQMMALNDVRIAARTVRQKVMLEGMEADPAIRLKYADKYARSANGWKKWQGERLAFKKLDVIRREELKEADFMEWVGRRPERVESYGAALREIKEAVSLSGEAERAFNLIGESFLTMGAAQVYHVFSMAYNRQQQADTTDTLAALRAGVAAALPLFKDYDESLEKKMALAMCSFYREQADTSLYPGGKRFAEADLHEYVDSLFDGSYFTSKERLAALKDPKAVSTDPVCVFYNELMKLFLPFRQIFLHQDERLSKGGRAFAAGLLAWKKGVPCYPDANSTMRLTYGTVEPYSPKDAVLYRHYTTLRGVLEKENPDDYEFQVPPRLKALYEARDFGRYADGNGALPTCFLTTNDITGGNSGSPVLNADGELIGLAFDGNWESMSGDVIFEPELQRCICVDIRYVLFLMDKLGGAGYLLDEMNIIQ